MAYRPRRSGGVSGSLSQARSLATGSRGAARVTAASPALANYREAQVALPGPAGAEARVGNGAVDDEPGGRQGRLLAQGGRLHQPGVAQAAGAGGARQGQGQDGREDQPAALHSVGLLEGGRSAP